MSTELRNVPNTDVSQTRFWGGEDAGTSIQLTRKGQYLQFTREEAEVVAKELLLFANKKEVEADD